MLAGAPRPGSPLSRVPAGVKLLGLLLFSALTVLFSGWIAAVLALSCAFAAALLAGLRGAEMWRIARGFLFIAAPLFALQVWRSDWQQAVAVVGDLSALLLAAGALTASTRSSDLQRALARALQPLGRIGVNAELVSLAISLTMRAVPQISELAAQTRQAAASRGLERRLRALTVPLVLRTVRQAQLRGEALAARGIGDTGDGAY